jgi:homoserine O-succinyltransferase/O-acetyltransferase
MPIKIPDDLPARQTLLNEGVLVQTESTAARQDIRPLRIALLNLMPQKIKTETQFARLIGATPLQVELSLIKMTNHTPKNTSPEHMIAFYRDWQDVRHEKFDGLIVTGAPIEHLPFEDVSYWDELTQIFDWTQTNVQSTFNICWGAQAALYHFHGVQKHTLNEKLLGIYTHKNLNPTSPFLRGFSDDFSIPVSRWTENLRRELPKDQGLEVLMESDTAGLCMIADPRHRALYMFNHIEYDTQTLNDEYQRDVKSGKPTAMPVNYFPGDNPNATPENRWRSHAHLLFGNWINELYQSTPFNIADIGQ